MEDNTNENEFKVNKDKEEKLIKIIKHYENQEGCLMIILKKAQEIYGYLSHETQNNIAKHLNIAIEDVYNVATFYSEFSLKPKGENKISVCLGASCYSKGSSDIFEKILKSLNIEGEQCTKDGKISLDHCICIGACGLGPVLTVNDEIYSKVKSDDIDDILNKYI
ncbi:MAG: NAD(P)H-dependent oxidoreductase subunit E [Oscillospiraceae bacterium]